MGLGFLNFCFDLHPAWLGPREPLSFLDTNSTFNRPIKEYVDVSLCLGCRECIPAFKSLIGDDYYHGPCRLSLNPPATSLLCAIDLTYYNRVLTEPILSCRNCRAIRRVS